MSAKHVKPGKHIRPGVPVKSNDGWPKWKVILVVVAAIFVGIVVIGAVAGESESAVESAPAETQPQETQPEEIQPEEAQPVEPTDDSAVFDGWRVTGSPNVTSLVTDVTVDDAGATVIFGPKDDTRNITGRIMSVSVGGTTYLVGDPAVTYQQVDGAGEWISDNALWSIGTWGDEPYDGGVRVTVQGLTPNDYSGITLTMDLDQTDPSAWDNENETISWTGQTLTLTHE